MFEGNIREKIIKIHFSLIIVSSWDGDIIVISGNTV